ncbi:MAG: TRAP transporter substrate-binding protein [Alphaproteobacteria bacterium]|nr:TRAP transporter substrate-binding protein [Alphaproteobacteria bacterium]
MRMLRAAAGAAVLAVGVAAAAAASAQTLRMAHIYTPGNIWYEAAEAYAKAVEQRSGGKTKIQIAHSGSTGDWPQSIEGLLIGTNDIVLQSVGTLDRYNTVAGVEAFPYLIRDIEHFKKVYYGPVGRELFDDIAQKTKFRIVGAGYRGARHLSNNKKIEKVEDLKGVKLRVPPLKMYRLTWDYLGASPVPMGVAELFTSMQSGVVDGQENPLEVLDGMKYYEVQKYVVETAHVIGAMTFIFSDARFKSLPAETRKILQEEGDKTMLAATDRMIGLESELKKKLQARGMQFIAIDAAPWRARLKDMPKEFPELAAWVAKVQAVQ